MMNRAALALAPLLALLGCKEGPDAKPEPPPSRFASVKKADTKTVAAKFCERTFEPKEKKWAPPPERALPGETNTDPNPTGEAWTWVNLWATWCGPCVEEMPLLGRWKDTLQKERLPLRMELWSIDEEQEALAGSLKKAYPGDIHWLRGEEDLPTLFAALGLPNDTAIPVHALVDPSGHLRCVRVGKVGEANYSAIKTILSGAL